MIRDCTTAILQNLESGRAAVVCRLVETRGSTPQKAGAMMLVYADGSQTGTLGGGCVEAEVKRQALGGLATGSPLIATFQLDHDYGWDDGLICGGRMQVLLAPLKSPEAADYFGQMARRMEAGQGLTEVVVFDSDSAELPAPSGWLFDDQQRPVAGWLAKQPAPAWISEQLKPLLERPRPYAVRGVAFLPALPRCRLVIVGGGHVGKAVADMAYDLDFDVWIIDDRAEYASVDRFPRAQRHIVGPMDQVLAKLDVDPNTYCLIITRGHNHDQEALYYLAERDARYVGLIGSRRKIKMIFEELRDAGVAAEALDRVYAPLGIDIGSQTVPEIAISICAELISHRNREGHVPGRPDAVRIGER